MFTLGLKQFQTLCCTDRVSSCSVCVVQLDTQYSYITEFIHKLVCSDQFLSSYTTYTQLFHCITDQLYYELEIPLNIQTVIFWWLL